MNGLFLSLLIGGGLGALLGRFGQCRSGACPLTANWKRGAIYGAVLGLLFHYASGGALAPYPTPKNVKAIGEAEFDVEVVQAGKPRYEGTWGTAILRLFNLTAGCTGANEKSLRKANIPFQALHLHPGSHAGYYPGAEPIAMKILFSPDTGKLLGAQAVGYDGVDKRIDVFATALKAGMTVNDLAEVELAYAPPFGSAKDPVNLAGIREMQRGLSR